MSAARSAVAVLAALLCAPGIATAGTTVSHVDGVEMIVGQPDPTPAPPSRKPKKKPAHHDAAPATQAALPAKLLGAATVVNTALAMIGVRYLWGGASPAGFDCSGLTWYAFARAGLGIPRTADQQFLAGRPVIGDPLPGDLVFFQTYDYGASHVGIYLGNGQFVNAIGSHVNVATFASPYFRSRYLGARRFLTPA